MIFSLIYRIISYPFRIAFQKLSPEKYAKKIGVNVDLETLHIYGNVFWPTEPWLITLGKNVYLTNNVTFITHDGGTLLFRKQQPDLELTKPIILGNDIYVGTNTTILPGVTIGNNVIIGACSVVTKNIPNNSVAVGNPAHIIKSASEYFEKAKNESLHLGHLIGREKDQALRKHFGYVTHMKKGKK